MSQALSPTQPLLNPSAAAPAAPLKVWMLLLVAALAVAAYANSLRNDFAFDDLTIVKNNPHVVDLEWTSIWTDNYWPRADGLLPDTLYRPLTLWTYLANQAIAPGVAWTFHLVNILLHGLVSVLVSLLAWRILGNRRVALVAGLLFAVHPIHTEVVANTVGRAELLAALWSALALLVFLPPIPLTQSQPLARRPWWHGLIVAACFLAAIFSKETPVALILAFPMLDLWRFLRQPKRQRPAWWRWLGRGALQYYLPLAAALAFYLKLRIAACGLANDVRTIHPIVNPLVIATLPERIATPFMLLAKYLWLMVWPVHLSADYSAPSLLPTSNWVSGNAFQPPAALGLMLVILALIGVVMSWRKAPQLALLAGLFAASYALVANFLRIGTIFGERLFYWPSVFVLILVAWGLVSGYQKFVAGRAPAARHVSAALAILLLAVPLGLMSRLTWQRNTDWYNNVALAISTARDNPDSGKACSWAGAVLVLADRPDFQAIGKTLIERAIELAPNYASARWELAKYYGARHDMAHSAIYIAQATRLDPGSHMSCLAVPALIKEMHAQPADSYMPLIQANLAAHPNDPAAYLALAYGYHAQEKYDDAAAAVRQCLDTAKFTRDDRFDQFHEAGAELAAIWLAQGRTQEALAKYRIYATFMAHSVDAQCAFAEMLMQDGLQFDPHALDEAQVHLQVAAIIDPSSPRMRGLVGQLNGLRRQQAHDLATAQPAHDTPAGAEGGVRP